LTEAPTDDFSKMLAEIEILFRHPPSLTFERKPSERVTFSFPAISAATDRRITTPPASELSRFFESATRKFYYQDFQTKDRAPELSWPNERISKKNRLVIERGTAQDGFVNGSKEAASEWFRLDLVDGIRAARQPSCSFFIGLPGSGKSTLIKYLINTERAYSDSSGVIFTRFESTKFFRYCAERIAPLRSEPSELWPVPALISCFRDYYWFIVLRDLILRDAFELQTDGTFARKKSSANFKDQRAIADFVERACEEARCDNDKHQQAFNALTAAISTKAFEHKHISQIEPLVRKAMVKLLSVSLKVCVIFDGLDALSPEDEILDTQKFKMLDFILVMYGYGSRGTETAFDPGIDHHAMIMLRPNTLERFMDRVDKEIATTRISIYRIAELSPGVVLLRAIRRALQDAGVPNADSEIFARILYRSLGTLLATIGTKFRLGRSAEALLSMFNGNLRDCFEYVMRVLVWIREEGESKTLHHRPSIADLVRFISSAEARRLLRQKNYRLVELMLFYQTSSFQNAVIAGDLSVLAPKAIKDMFAQPNLQKNKASRGLIDNVFNYHSFDSLGRNDDHNLLYKIRILQICSARGRSTTFDLLSELAKLGYDADGRGALERAVTILRFVGFLNRSDDGGTSSYSISTKGRVVLERLIYQSSYLEHVFHKTLLPSVLIARDKPDTPRADGPDRWTTESIRNYFTLLAYVKFVENNVARGKTVPEKFRIWPGMLGRWWRPFVVFLSKTMQTSVKEARRLGMRK
jgi:hypothetical protein